MAWLTMSHVWAHPTRPEAGGHRVGRRQEAPLDGEDRNQQHTQPEGGQGLDRDHPREHAQVGLGPPPPSRDRPQDHPRHRRHDQRQPRDQQGPREPIPDHVDDGPARPERVPEVPGENVPPVAEVLLPEGCVQTHPRHDLGPLIRAQQADIHSGDEDQRVAGHEPGQQEVEGDRHQDDHPVLGESTGVETPSQPVNSPPRTRLRRPMGARTAAAETAC